MSKKPTIKPEDLYKLKLITGGNISPDGSYAAYSLEERVQKGEKKYSSIWIVPSDRGKARQFTFGKSYDSNPKWSPDSKSIAFISNRDDEKQSQIYVIPVDGGEARKLTDLKGEIFDFEWSPDGKRFLLWFREKDSEQIEREEDEEKKKLGIVDRHITRTIYKLDGYGYLPKNRMTIWVVNANTGKAEQITKNEIWDDIEPSWSPDGKEIIFSSNRSKDPDLNPDDFDIFIVNVKNKRKKKLNTPAGVKLMPSISPCGNYAAYYGVPQKKSWAANMQLWVVPADGKGRAKSLTKDMDIQALGTTINDLPHMGHRPPVWINNGEDILITHSEHGNNYIYSIKADGSAEQPEFIVKEKGAANGISIDKSGEKLLYFKGEMDNPGQLYLRELKTGKTKKLTKHNESFLKRRDLGETDEVWFKGKDGYELQGWILKPPGFDGRKKYPSILEIHGGPMVQYGNMFMHEFYVLAAEGYVVYFSNPRGGKGYGEEHCLAIDNAWGSVDYEDVMSFRDYMAKQPYIDTKKMGVTGGSYGGYMTNWIVGNTNKFKAAVTQRSVSNLISMYGSSDFNWQFEKEFGNRPAFRVFNHYWKMSPMKHISNCKTPMLVIHSEQDLRCPQEQGEQIYVALKRLGVDTELVLFPEEPHGLSRGGRTDRRISRLGHIVRWFDKYLK